MRTPFITIFVCKPVLSTKLGLYKQKKPARMGIEVAEHKANIGYLVSAFLPVVSASSFFSLLGISFITSV